MTLTLRHEAGEADIPETVEADAALPLSQANSGAEDFRRILITASHTDTDTDLPEIIEGEDDGVEVIVYENGIKFVEANPYVDEVDTDDADTDTEGRRAPPLPDAVSTDPTISTDPIVSTLPVVVAARAAVKWLDAADREMSVVERKRWPKHVEVGHGFVEGRRWAMAKANTDKWNGKLYAVEFSRWLQANQLHKYLDKGHRNKLLVLMDELDQVEAWRADMDPKKRDKLNHPHSVWHAWKKCEKRGILWRKQQAEAARAAEDTTTTIGEAALSVPRRCSTPPLKIISAGSSLLLITPMRSVRTPRNS